MKTVFVLIDHPNLDYLLVPVVRRLHRSGRVRVVPCVCDFGNESLLREAGIPYTRQLDAFGEFVRTPGRKLFLNGAHADWGPHLRGKQLDLACRERGAVGTALCSRKKYCSGN